MVFACFVYFRKNEAINRPKSDFVPTSLSDLNMDTLSMGSNNDRYNNNGSNFGGRFNNNLNKSKANLYASQQNLSSSKHSNTSTTTAAGMPSKSFSRSKIYGSQSSISTSSSGYRSVNVNNNNNNNNNIGNNSNNAHLTSPVDNWLNAWDDNNNFQAQVSNRPPSYQQQQQQHQQQQVRQHTAAMFSTSKPQTFNDKFNFEKPNSIHKRQIPQNDDPWAGELRKSKNNYDQIITCYYSHIGKICTNTHTHYN